LKNISNETPKGPANSCQKQRVQPLTEPIAGSIINQPQRNPTPPTNTHKEHQPAKHGFTNSAYLALTFSTLLSSQDSLTHHHQAQTQHWGNSTYSSPRPAPSQIGAFPTTCHGAAPKPPRGWLSVSVARSVCPGPATWSEDRRPASLRAWTTLHPHRRKSTSPSAKLYTAVGATLAMQGIGRSDRLSRRACPTVPDRPAGSRAGPALPVGTGSIGSGQTPG
jgi:hypothetical protein